jgi:hypothetical protein
MAHTLPQAPQFAGSLRVSVHAPLQDVSGSVHVQAPPEQVAPTAQALPHEPQWLFELGR